MLVFYQAFAEGGPSIGPVGLAEVVLGRAWNPKELLYFIYRYEAADR